VVPNVDGSCIEARSVLFRASTAVDAQSARIVKQNNAAGPRMPAKIII
jgi:hypothetical protein